MPAPDGTPAPRPPAPRPPRVPACRAARHWGKGRGAEGRRSLGGDAAPRFCFAPLVDCRHGGTAAAHQPREELLRRRLRGRVPGVRGTPAGHHQGEGRRGVAGRAAGAGGEVAGGTTFPGGHRAGRQHGGSGELRFPTGAAGPPRTTTPGVPRGGAVRALSAPCRHGGPAVGAQRALPKRGVNSGAFA